MAGFDPDRYLPQPTLTGPQTAEAAGIDYEVATRAWRALGLPVADPTEVAYDENDLQSLVAFAGLVDLGFPLDSLIAMARTYGQALSRIADAETRLFAERFLADESSADEDDLARLVPQLLELIDAPLKNMHRRHLRAAMRTLSEASGEDTTRLAVGFADLVDFTSISGDLPGEELGTLVSGFEEAVLEICNDSGVRMVKTIGDAVMFVSPDATRAVTAALGIVERAASDDHLPLARAGIDLGDTLPFGGDYFGRPVNVAARITAFALPSTVVVSKDVLAAFDEQIGVSKIGRRRLKGVGEISLYKINDLSPEVDGGT